MRWHKMLYRPLCSPASWGDLEPPIGAGLFRVVDTDFREPLPSRTFVNKGKKKGRGCYYAPALVRYVALTVRSTHGDGSAQLSRYIHLP